MSVERCKSIFGPGSGYPLEDDQESVNQLQTDCNCNHFSKWEIS